MSILPPEPESFSERSTNRGWRQWQVMVPLLLGLIGFIYIGYLLDWNARVIAGVTLLIGMLSGVFAWLLSLIGLMPLVGPLVVKVLSFSFIWLLNAVGYLISFIAIRRGYSKDVLTYRGLTIALMIGIVIGYIVAQYL